MRVSVIIPAYNCTQTIERCISSVKAQTYTDWECIIVDDHSTDGSGEMIDVLIDGDGRFKAIHCEKNGKTSAARNRGIREATGEALFFLDDDDWLEPQILEYAVFHSLLYPEAGRIFIPALTRWEQTGEITYWSAHPIGVHGPNSVHLFRCASCDVGHVTGSLYVLKNIPDGISFPVKVRVFEDMITNMGLIFSGITTVITDRCLYNYVRRHGSQMASLRYTDKDAKEAIRSFDSLVGKYSPAWSVENRCRSFMMSAIDSQLNKKIKA